MEDCVFCDRAKFEERIVGENEYFFIVATLGQISNGGYVLLIPKRHVCCLGAMEEYEVEYLEAAQKKISAALSKEYTVGSLTVFEHGILGQTIKHAHLHYLPEACSITERIRRGFPGNEISIILSLSELQRLYKEKQEPYLFWTDSGREMNVCWNPFSVPPQYLRLIIAEALGRPERGNWRNMDPELDKRLIRETILRLKPYFLKP
ncbi:MAG: HIT domain-containing protein [Candidatus Nealsonbacteria bacterium]|nr:HIT domain-containing protein [Candidatus Nealsonbacteria bacterium]